MHTVQKGFASFTQQSLSSCCVGHMADREATDTLSTFLELISWQKSRATGTSWGGRGSLAWGRQGGQDLYQREGKPGEGKQRQGRVERMSQEQIPAKQCLCKGPGDRKGQSLLEERSWAAQGFVNRSGGELESFILRRGAPLNFYQGECKYKAT